MTDTHFVADEELARRLLGLSCLDCGSKHVVYAISRPYTPAFPEGAYCYKCLSIRCRKSRIIPFPIPENILNALQYDLILDKFETGHPKLF